MRSVDVCALPICGRLMCLDEQICCMYSMCSIHVFLDSRGVDAKLINDQSRGDPKVADLIQIL